MSTIKFMTVSDFPPEYGWFVSMQDKFIGSRMRNLKLTSIIFLATLLLKVPSGAMACGSASKDHFDHQEQVPLSEFPDDQIKYLARELEIERSTLVLAPGTAFVRFIDINDDGVSEICVSLQTSATCSNGVAICKILVLEDWKREPLAQFAGHLLVAEKVTGQDWSNLVGVWASSDGSIRRKTLEFHSGSYVAGPPQIIGSWADKRCLNGEFVPRTMCSPELVEVLKRRQ